MRAFRSRIIGTWRSSTSTGYQSAKIPTGHLRHTGIGVIGRKPVNPTSTPATRAYAHRPYCLRETRADTITSLSPLPLYQPRYLNRGAHKISEQRMRRKRFGFQLWVELHTDKPRVVFPFDDLWQLAIGRHPRKMQAQILKLITVFRIHLIAVAMTFLDSCARPYDCPAPIPSGDRQQVQTAFHRLHGQILRSLRI